MTTNLSDFNGKRDRMPSIQEALQVSEEIGEKLDPLAIILFGSVAKGGSGNDLDFLIVIEEQKPLSEVDEKLRNLRKKLATADLMEADPQGFPRPFWFL